MLSVAPVWPPWPLELSGGLKATVPAALDSGWIWGRTGWVHVSATPLISGGLGRLLSALHLGVPRRSWRPRGCLSSSLSGDPCLWAPAGQALSGTDGCAEPASPFAFCLLWAGGSLQTPPQGGALRPHGSRQDNTGGREEGAAGEEATEAFASGFFVNALGCFWGHQGTAEEAIGQTS